jgi:ParB family chromosome partitioning protein
MILKKLSLDQLREPEYVAREWIEEESLAELAESIKARGVEIPIRVIEREGLYEIQDGHRRFLAARMAGMVTIPALVVKADEIGNEIDKLTCNLYREEMSALDKSRILHKLKDDHGVSIEDLAKMMGVNESRIWQLLSLEMLSEPVRDALADKRIGEHIAKEINKLPRKKQDYYLQYAMDGGATIRTVKGWVQQELSSMPPPDEDPDPPAGPPPAPGKYEPLRMKCKCCNGWFDPNVLITYTLCPDCSAETPRIFEVIREAVCEVQEGKPR